MESIVSRSSLHFPHLIQMMAQRLISSWLTGLLRVPEKMAKSSKDWIHWKLVSFCIIIHLSVVYGYLSSISKPIERSINQKTNVIQRNKQILALLSSDSMRVILNSMACCLIDYIPMNRLLETKLQLAN